MTSLDTTAPLNLEAAYEALREHASAIAFDPQTNSVFDLARTTFLDLESGKRTVDEVEALVDTVFERLITGRADRFRKQHFPEDGGIWEGLEADLDALGKKGWAAFKAAVEHPTGGIVFTAHPTFALSRRCREAFAKAVVSPDEAGPLKDEVRKDGRDWSASITLEGEHDEVQQAIVHAQAAMADHVRLVLKTAQKHFPDEWAQLRPAPPSIAGWVGYDLDGRTDIDWWQSFAFRLGEKAVQLGRYAVALTGIAKRLADAPQAGELRDIALRLSQAGAQAEEHAARFKADLNDPQLLVEAANALTGADSSGLTDLAPVIATLETLAGDVDDAGALDLLVLAAQMRMLQMGTARIHLRLNAAQIRTVISRDLHLETESRELGRRALTELSEKAKVDQPLPVNFADLFIEQSTARRQFMMCAQLLKHVDAGSDIRFLIAESENPATVMGALYLARQYGVDERLDISPLFETPEALETAGRFIEQLLGEPEFLRYVKARGYLSIQLGFSDAGRFIGQVSADMAIERIHNIISRAVADSGADVELLIFNTHGESMGRGAWPGTFKQRFDHLLSQWTRSQSTARGVALRHEVSFQGGDGFLHFANPPLARATYGAFARHLLSETDAETASDPFYTRTDLVWDFYRALRSWHERLFDEPSYAALLGDFATNFLVKAGSRQRRRSSGPTGPRSLRAISHNATLQQLGVPLNTASGIGSALRKEQDQVKQLIRDSERMRGLMRLAAHARAWTSVPALRAYARLYDPSLWVALARTASPDYAVGYRRLYYTLQNRETATGIEAIANRLSIDFNKFDQILETMDGAPSPAERHEARLDIHTLHAMRQALMMKALSVTARLPSVSPRHEEDLRDILAHVREMRIKDAVTALRRIFPASLSAQDAMKRIEEPGHMGEAISSGYDDIHASIINPLDDIDRILHRTTLAICQAYGAFG